MSDFDGLRRGLRDGALLCVAFLLPLLLVLWSAPGRAAPPAQFGTGWTQLPASGTANGGPIGVVPSDPGAVSYQVVELSKFMCADPFQWGFVVTQDPGTTLYFPFSCNEPDWSNTLISGSEVWVRALYATSPPAPPASSPASSPAASSGDIDRLMRAVQAVLMAVVLGAGVAGYRLGLA